LWRFTFEPPLFFVLLFSSCFLLPYFPEILYAVFLLFRRA
jgi:hypothetical protein